MATIVELVRSGAVVHLPTAAWDLKSFLENTKSYVQTVGGLLLMVLGAAGLVWGGVLLVKKLMGNQQQSHQQGWGQIGMLILIGGALTSGGWQFMNTVGSGGQTTIEELGGGTIIVQSFDEPSQSDPAVGSP